MGSSWTLDQNKVFELALATYDKDTPDRWQNVARAVGNGKSVDDVKRHFEEMKRDVADIFSEGASSSNSKGGGSSEEQRYLKPQ